jgi:RNA polymerase-binding transcription factor DksA
MNNARREKLNDIRNNLETQKENLESVMDEEQMAFDNLTEGLQATMRGSFMEEAIDNMNAAIEAIDEAIEYIDSAAI